MPSFIVITKEHGIILIDIIEEEVIQAIEKDSNEYWHLSNGSTIPSRSFITDIYSDEVISRLKNNPTLYNRKTKSPKVPIKSALVFCANQDSDIQRITVEYEDILSSIKIDNFQNWLSNIPTTYNCNDVELGKIYSLLEGTFIYEDKPSFIEEEKLKTIDDYIKKSLKTTFKQDSSQRLASMQLPPGPQRIRGLAGTGKTIVLCLKAAITHKSFKDYKILYLFNTQSLYQHVQNLISKHYTLEAKRAPDFEEKLRVIHAWGGRQKPGLYSELCNNYGISPLTLNDAKGKGDALQYIYKDLLRKIGDELVPEYDLALIDEAQDFPDEVFQVVFKLTKGDGLEKRIIWAYDEFQSLRDTEIKEPADLFGLNSDGEPNFPNSCLEGKYAGSIPKDFVLPNCYRTPRPVLLTAHGVAMGLYTKTPTIILSDPRAWLAIGYRIIEPRSLQLRQGDKVKIERPDENSTNLLESILRENHKTPINLIQSAKLEDGESQCLFIADKIVELTTVQGVAPEEIIIVNLQPGNNKDSMLRIRHALYNAEVRSVIPGYVESADVFKPRGFVTITTPYRAKGNEANIVFVINAQSVVSDYTNRMRNAFFVAVTRSRGWCYVFGIGDGMDQLIDEIERIRSDFPNFNFEFPDPKSIDRGKNFLKKSDQELDKYQHAVELLEKNPEFMQDFLERINKN